MCVQDLILLTCAQCLHCGVCGLCTAVAACWRGLTHIFTIRTNHKPTASPASPSSASAPPTYPPPASSFSMPPSPKRLFPDPLVAGSSSLNETSGASQTMATLGQWNSLLTTQNCWLSSHLKVPSLRYILYALDITCSAANLPPCCRLVKPFCLHSGLHVCVCKVATDPSSQCTAWLCMKTLSVPPSGEQCMIRSNRCANQRDIAQTSLDCKTQQSRFVVQP